MLHHGVDAVEAKARAIELLHKVRIDQPETRIFDYPHQCSVGMCQRIMIAMTLSMEPSLLIADEPTASLDVTTQKQILKLLHELKDELSMSMILISHDLGVVAEHCDHVVEETATPHIWWVTNRISHSLQHIDDFRNNPRDQSSYHRTDHFNRFKERIF